MDPGGDFSFKKVTWMTIMHHSSPNFYCSPMAIHTYTHTFCFLDTTDETMTTNKDYLSFIFKK
jgi:hypothetical protein